MEKRVLQMGYDKGLKQKTIPDHSGVPNVVTDSSQGKGDSQGVRRQRDV